MWAAIIYLVVTTILTIALAPKPPVPRAAGISDFSLPTADQGRNIPVLFGTCNITGANVVWYGDLETKPMRVHSLFSSQTTGYQYFMGIHLVLGHGPFDSINKVLWDQKPTWVGPAQTISGQICMSNLNLYGGTPGGQGGIQGCFDIVMGTPTEAANAYLTAQLGTVPAFRGVVSAIWKTGDITAVYTQSDLTQISITAAGCGYIGTTPYVKALEFECTRILHGWNTSGGVWYSAKAVINHTQDFSSPPTWSPTFQANTFGPTVNPGDTTLPIDVTDTDWNLQSAGFIFIGSEWIKVIGPTTGSDGHGGTILAGALIVERGLFGTTPGTYLNNTIFQFYEVDVSSVLAMNPAHIIYQCLTDPYWGLGLPLTQIDDTQFRTAADTFFAENMGLCMQWVNASTVEDFVKIVLNHCAASLIMTSRGTYQLIPLRGGYNVATLPVYDQTDIVEMTNFQTQSWADEVNEVVMTYTDPSTARDTSVTAQDLANIDLQGKVVSQQVNYQGIRDHNLAATVVGRELNARATPLLTVKFKINRFGFGVSSGGLFVLNWPPRNLVGGVFRITTVSSGTVQDNTISVEAVQDIYSLGNFNYQLSSSIPPTQVLTPAQVAAAVAPAPNQGPTVISATLTAPPGTPGDGDRYIVPTGATGVWAGHSGSVAVWDANTNAWVFLPIPPGTAIYDNSSGLYLTTNGSGVVVQATFTSIVDIVQIKVFGD